MQKWSNLIRTNGVRAFFRQYSIDLSGIYPPIATPFNADSGASLALDKLEQNLAKWSTLAFRGYVVLGSSAECPYLSRDEKFKIVQTVKNAKRADQLLIVGTGCESTVETIELSNEMRKLGADVLLLITPSFYKASMTPVALERHYNMVADKSSLPILLYNVPANTGVELAAESCVKLAKHERIIGMKDSAGDITKLTGIIDETKDEDFQVLAGSAGFQLAALHIGCVGGVHAAANCFGSQLIELVHSFRDGDWKKALQLQTALVRPNNLMTRKYGIPALKYAMDKTGLYGGPVRPPLMSLSEEQKVEIDRTLQLL